jgi:HSP20 family molecular chaperone IbpA
MEEKNIKFNLISVRKKFLVFLFNKIIYLIILSKGEFRPEELNVKVEGRMLIVKGDRQVKVGNATESKQFNRELTLPEFVDVKSLQSYLSDDGQLTMEAPVLLDRVYNNSGSTVLPSSNINRLVDTTFTGGRQPASNIGYGNNQSNAYSSTSSSSSFRQDGSGLRDTNNFHRNSPLRDQYSSTTSSSSTLVGGGSNNNQAPTTFSTGTSRPDYFINDRNDGTKNVTYTFDLNQFAPEDIAIQINDTTLKVTALKQERDAHGSTHREFRREIGKIHFYFFLQ